MIWVMDGHDQLVTIRQFGDMAEVLLAKSCLESAGIETFLADANIARMEWPISRGVRLQVNANDAEAATVLWGNSPPSVRSARPSLAPGERYSPPLAKLIS